MQMKLRNQQLEPMFLLVVSYEPAECLETNAHVRRSVRCSVGFGAA